MITAPSNGRLAIGLTAFISGLVGCDLLDSPRHTPALSHDDEQALPIDPAKGPRANVIGALARRVSIRAQPSARAPVVGLMTAGATIGRAEKPQPGEDCPGGWYPVTPHGFVCLDPQTTLDPHHPTLQARGLRADPQAHLPYPYARTRRALPLFEPDPEHRDGVRERGRMNQGSTFAIVGSWDTLDEYDQRQRLAMLTLGVFVPTRDLEPLHLDSASGVTLDNTTAKLPLAFALSAKVQVYQASGAGLTPHGFIEDSRPLAITVKTRTFEANRYLLLPNDNYVAERDVAVARQRHEFPDSVAPSTHWLDIDVAQGLIVAYIGQQPNFVTKTLGRPGASIPRGTTSVKAKQVTDLSLTKKPANKQPGEFDVPWVIELASGVTLCGGWNADDSTVPARTIEVHAEDAGRLFRFIEPSLPEGWHAVTVDESTRNSSPIVLR